jgi:hypothetical protein
MYLQRFSDFVRSCLVIAPLSEYPVTYGGNRLWWLKEYFLLPYLPTRCCHHLLRLTRHNLSTDYMIHATDHLVQDYYL